LLKEIQWMSFMIYSEASQRFRRQLRRANLYLKWLEEKSLTSLQTPQEEPPVTYCLRDQSRTIAAQIQT
jgi:hypothetical protein